MLIGEKEDCRERDGPISALFPRGFSVSLMNDWTARDRRVAIWSALGTCFFGLLYTPTLVAGFVSAGNVTDPLTDPFLGILEIQIILMAPFMVLMMVAVHGYAPRGTKMYSFSALGFMILCAGLTTCVHFVELTVARRIDPTSMPAYFRLFSWEWPSVDYALDIVAWDWFFGLSMLLAAPVFKGGKLHTSVRACMILSGTLSIAGLLGAALGDMQLRGIGIAGYAGVFPVVCLLLALVFSRTRGTNRK
jgi:hypothetical protein